MLQKVLIPAPAGIVMLTLACGGPVSQLPSVSLAVHGPGTLTRYEPVVVEFTVENKLEKPLLIALGNNDVGYLRMTLRRPDGAVTFVDPQQPRRPDESYVNVERTLQPGEHRTQHVFLNDWFGTLEKDGEYQLTVDFVGPARTSSGDTVDVGRRMSLGFTILPFNEPELRTTCERLVQTARRSAEPLEVVTAGRALSFVTHPVAIEYLERVIERGRVIEHAAVASYAIRALEAFGTTEAHDALQRVRSKVGLSTVYEVDAALRRMGGEGQR